MPSSTSSVVPLIQHWETFVQECKAARTAPSLSAFAGWLSRRVAPDVQASSNLPQDAHYQNVRLSDKAAMLVWRLSRFMRVSFKQHFADSPLQSIDEFSLLAGSHYLQEPTKTQLFQYDLMETTTGLQMLARLIRHGLLEERPDTADRRQKRVVLTPAGRALFEQAADQMDLIADDLLHILPQEDLEQLANLLARLNHHLTTKG